MEAAPMKALTLGITLFLVASNPSAAQRAGAQPSINGLWDAVIVSNGIEIPFRFEIESTSAGTVASGVLRLEYDHLNTTLEAKLEDGQLVGIYRNNRSNAKPNELRMRR